MYKKKRFFAHMLLCALFMQTLPAQVQLSSEAQTLLQNASNMSEPQQAIQALRQGLNSVRNKAGEKEVLCLLAEYEVLSNAFLDAGQHYQAAAALATGDETRGLLLKAARCFLAAASDEQAVELLNQLEKDIPQSSNTPLDCEIRVYRLLTDFKLGFEPVALLQSYIDNPAYTQYHPVLLFTLWWFSEDENAKRVLEKRFPNSLETAIISGEVALTPSVFWYFFPRQAEKVRQFNAAVQTDAQALEPKKEPGAQSTGTQTTPLWYQVGFFKTQAYAVRLQEELAAKGFNAVIREEPRPQDKYFAVLLTADATMLIRLKDAGYEAVPIYE